MKDEDHAYITQPFKEILAKKLTEFDSGRYDVIAKVYI